MKKLWILLGILCMLAGSFTVHAENYHEKGTIALDETKVITIPKPNGEIDPTKSYFTQAFTFVPEKDGVFAFRAECEDDRYNPYHFGTRVDHWASSNAGRDCVSFEGRAGETYLLRFFYRTHDGRYPEFTLSLSEVHNYSLSGNFELKDTISPGETKVVKVPLTVGPYNHDVPYFTQDFEFVAQENGTYRFLVRYEEDESEPYTFRMNARYWTEDPKRQNGEKEGSNPNSTGEGRFQSFDYLELENGIEFEGWAGETYRLRFAFPEDDYRYPEFTFSLDRKEHYYREDTISFKETKVFSVPQPEGEIDPSRTYFTQDFVFVPKRSRTCRVLISYEKDGSGPYNFSLMEYIPNKDPLENGDEIEVIAGEPIRLRFQYPIHDGRYPEFTISITPNRDPIEAGMLLYPGIVILACVIAVMPPIRLRKKNR